MGGHPPPPRLRRGNLRMLLREGWRERRGADVRFWDRGMPQAVRTWTLRAGSDPGKHQFLSDL